MTPETRAPDLARGSLELLYSISRELTAELDLHELLQRVLKLTLEKVGAASGSIIVLDEVGKLTEGAVAYDGVVQDHTMQKLQEAFKRGLAGWVFEHRQAAFVASTHDDKRWLRRSEDEFDEESRSAISVPLLARGRVVGVLTMVHPQAGHFREDHLALLQAIADQAGIAVENARLYTAEQERRQFASTLQEIARTINSTLDLKDVFSQVLEQLGRLISYDSASIFMVDDDHLRLVAAQGFKNVEAALGLSIPLDRDDVSASVLLTGQPLVIEDVQKDPRWIHVDSIPESKKIRGWIGAPLMVRDQAVGVLNIDCHRVGAYGSTEAEVVSAFADQIATAVANARLFSQSQRRVQALAALAYTARVVNASMDLHEVLEHILTQTMDGLDAQGASVALLDEDNGDLEYRYVRGEPAEKLLGLHVEKGKGIAGWVAETNEAVVIQNAQADPRFYEPVDGKTGEKTRVIAAAPILVQARTIGILEAINPTWAEGEQEQVDLLMGIAYLAGTAITRAQLFSETQTARQRYASLFEDSIDPILITDLQGSITDANHRAEDFLGFSHEDLVGRSVLELKLPHADELIDDLAALEPDETLSYERGSGREEEGILPIELHIKQINMGSLPFLQWILRDISERLELDELRSDLTSMIFHDLRAPLGNIFSSLEVMQTTSPEDEAFQSVLSIAQRSSRRASRLVESLLDLDRLEEGKAVLDKSLVAIDGLIAEAAEEVHPTAEAKGHTLQFNMAPHLPALDVDADMIQRVIINLMENAIKYTRSGGKIVVAVQKSEGGLQVSVSDSGPGISQRDQQRIFEKYARIHREGRPKGRGLGLAFCRLAVEAHGGRIWVESLEGTGSTFCFWLPIP